MRRTIDYRCHGYEAALLVRGWVTLPTPEADAVIRQHVWAPLYESGWAWLPA